MKRWVSRVRTPVVRERAHSYILVLLLSFAATIAGTRLFLELTGYPTIGGGELHIAHVLWGGLLLFGSCLVLLTVANRWTLLLGASLGGVGMGFFMDEIGKFITTSNDYFFPAAAPIIYAFFLLTILIYLQIRKARPHHPRVELYRVLDQISELLDSDLQESELLDIRQRLNLLVQTEHDPALVRLAETLLTFLNSQSLELAPDNPGAIERFLQAVERFQERWLTRPRLRWVLIAGLSALAAVSILNLIRFSLGTFQPETLEILLIQLIENKPIAGIQSLYGFLIQTGVQAAAGLFCLSSVILFFLKKDQRALTLAYYGLLLCLTIGNILIFYYEQFSTIILASLQFLLLLAVLDFRNRFNSVNFSQNTTAES
ncbi:MAG: hypothetical protein JXA25_12555 [Anaerolineales bacterium]|nr:hypothetical protein [Anaerolineales bacterium]